MSIKSETEVNLVQAQYLHPFDTWKRNIHTNNKMMIAAIPMVRNLIEYTQGQASPYYLKLTSLLHQKADSSSITLAELGEIFNNILSLNLTFGTGYVLPLIFQDAESCLAEAECINLENKVVLSMPLGLPLKLT